MRAMVFEEVGKALQARDLSRPRPARGEVLLRVKACGVCRTDLHIVDGELTEPKLPLVLGHEIVGEVVELGVEVADLGLGDRVGVPWLGGSCGDCDPCRAGRENLCDGAIFTGYQRDGGYAEYARADARYCFPIPDCYGDAEAAPLLCAGLIGYRSYRMTGDARRLGIYGFGAAAHILTQIANHQGREVYAFTRPGDLAGQGFAREIGAVWAGDSNTAGPVELDAAILFAPVGALVPTALRAVAKGGVVVCAGIYMSAIPSFSYDLLWGERVLRSVANLTRRDGVEFLRAAEEAGVRSEVEIFSLGQANEALRRLRSGEVRGAAVLLPDFEP